MATERQIAANRTNPILTRHRYPQWVASSDDPATLALARIPSEAEIELSQVS